MTKENVPNDECIDQTIDIVTSYVANNSLSSDRLSALIKDVYSALSGLGQQAVGPEVLPEPSVSARSSVKKDHIVCLEDGKKMKMLKRHLMTDHGMTPDEYRARWRLASDYPMVAPDYADKRRELAKKIGLGRKSSPGQRRHKKTA